METSGTLITLKDECNYSISTDKKMIDFDQLGFIGESDSEAKEPMGICDAMLSRSVYLKQLRLLEMQDEIERLNSATSESNDEEMNEEKKDADISDSSLYFPTDETFGEWKEDQIEELQNGKTVLKYDSFLSHQRYYDNYKHVNVSYFDFGLMGDSNSPIMIEQKRSLGKGGLVWDCGYILAEHLILTQSEWLKKSDIGTRVVELGAGTGITGILLAKALKPELNCEVTITDLPELLDLMNSNIKLNSSTSCLEHIGMKEYNSFHYGCLNHKEGSKNSKIKAEVLEWGQDKKDYKETYDVIIGGDIVASIYDPIKLARTLYDLTTSSQSRIIISVSSRLSELLDTFLAEIHRIFDFVDESQPLSRNKNPKATIFNIYGRKDGVFDDN